MPHKQLVGFRVTPLHNPRNPDGQVLERNDPGVAIPCMKFWDDNVARPNGCGSNMHNCLTGPRIFVWACFTLTDGRWFHSSMNSGEQRWRSGPSPEQKVFGPEGNMIYQGCGMERARERYPPNDSLALLQLYMCMLCWSGQVR